MLAGLMGATMLGGIAPAYAQTMENGRGDRTERSARDGDRQRGDAQRGGVQRVDGQRGGGQWRGDRPQQQAQTQPVQRDGGNAPRWQGRSDDRGAPGQPGPQRPDRRWENDRGRADVNRPDMNRPQPGSQQQGRSDDRRGWTDNDRRPDQRGDWRDNRRGSVNGGWAAGNNWDRDRDRNGGNWNNGRRFDDRTRWSTQQRWNNGWRQDRRYDWNSYRSRYGDRYRLGDYRAPRGWNYGYRQFSVGIVLDRLLYSNSYWLNDPSSYRLPPAYGTLRWVRYYDDAMLVDIRDGYVVDVIHDFFW
ncbi:RcnB family protein [Sphingobium sp.]|uniref:RcnB family protein n=1 Tax=Sphingobium sp. TaxID=1912891 RepID=UPI003BB7DBE6